MQICSSTSISTFSNYSKREKAFLAFLAISSIVYIALSYYVRFNQAPLWKVRLSSSMTVLLMSGTAGFMLYKRLTKKTEKVAIAALSMTTQCNLQQPTAKKTKVLVLAKLTSKPGHQNSPFFGLPDDLIFLIFSHIGSVKKVGQLGLVSRKLFDLTHTSQAWKPLLQRLFPQNTFDLTQSPISFLANLAEECESIEEALSADTIEALGGTNRIYMLPFTDFFSDKKCDPNFYRWSWFTSNAPLIFNKAPMVRCRDQTGQVGVFVHINEIANSKVVQSHFLMLGDFKIKDGRKTTIWWDDCFFDHKQEKYLSNKSYLTWWQNCFSGKLSSLDELFRTIGQENTLFHPNHFFQISIYSFK